MGDLEYSAAGGLVGAILGAIGAFFGVDRRIKKVEDEQNKLFLEFGKVVYKDTCDTCTEGANTRANIIDTRLLTIEGKLDKALATVNYISGLLSFMDKKSDERQL